MAVELLKSFCLPGLLHAVEAISLTATSVHILGNCINRALYKIFGACDSDSFKQMRQWLGLPSVSVLVENRLRTFMDILLDESRFFCIM